MATVLCDPNYDPSLLYSEIETLLYFYDRIYLYAPSQGQIQNAGLDWQRLKRLIEHGFIVPVGRAFWFDSKARDELSARNVANHDRSNTYRWSELDEFIVSLGSHSETPEVKNPRPGYLVVSDDHRKYADEMEQAIPAQRSEAFGKLVDYTARLRQSRQLPNELLHGEFSNASDERLAARLVHHTAGDLRLGDSLGVASVFSTDQMGYLYHAVSRSFLREPAPSSGPPLTVLDPQKEYRLSRDQLRIAASLAQQIAQDESIGPLDIELLIEYRDTDCCRLFRDFVSAELQSLGSQGRIYPDSANTLKAVFDGKINLVDVLSDYGPSIAAITVTELCQELLDRKTENRPISRRAFIDIVAAIAFSMFSDRLLPRVVDRGAARVVASEYDAIFAIVRRQRELLKGGRK